MKRIHSLILTLALVLGLVACAKAPTWQEQYDLGVRYLSEGNYQEAIIAFTAAIEIDPKQENAYIGLADAYIAASDIDAAIAVLREGLGICDNTAKILDVLARIEKEQQVYSKLALADVRCEYSEGSNSYDERVIGTVIVEFSIVEPTEVAFAEIEVFSDSESIDEAIRECIAFIEPKATPYEKASWGLGMPIYSWASGSSVSVVVLGFDSSGEFVGYSIVDTLEIP